MKTNKNTFWNLLILFELVFLAKLAFAFLNEAPFIISDEPCALIIARYFAHNLSLSTCEAITTLPGGTPYPLYSILLSPLTLLFEGKQLFYAALSLNALLVSTLVFPLFGIFKEFIRSNKNIFLSIIFILFLPQFLIYEKTVMTETLFVVINIWLIHFYIRSFTSDEKKSRKNKFLTFTFSILSTLTRPFGFISPIALIINEFIINKKKKTLLILPFLLILILGIISTFNENISSQIISKFQSILINPANTLYIFKALFNQLNSLTIATLFIPLIIFPTYINKLTPKVLPKIKYFLLIYITLNFLISAQHIYGYFINDNFDPGLITRYIHSSIIIIFIFAAAFFQRFTKFEFNKTNLTIITVSIISLVFLNFEGAKHTLNTDLSIFMHTREHLFDSDYSLFKDFFRVAIIPTLFVLFLLTIFNYRKIYLPIFVSLIGIQALFSLIWVSNYTKLSPLTEYFIGKKTEIAFMLPNEEGSQHIWYIRSLTNNDVKVVLINAGPPDKVGTIKISEDILNKSDYLKKADYVVTPYQTDLRGIFQMNELYLYENTKKLEN